MANASHERLPVLFRRRSDTNASRPEHDPTGVKRGSIRLCGQNNQIERRFCPVGAKGPLEAWSRHSHSAPRPRQLSPRARIPSQGRFIFAHNGSCYLPTRQTARRMSEGKTRRRSDLCAPAASTCPALAVHRGGPTAWPHPARKSLTHRRWARNVRAKFPAIRQRPSRHPARDL